MNEADPLPGALGAAIAAATGQPMRIATVAPLGGGCIHSAFRVEGRNASSAATFFAKVNDAASQAMFAAEADGLDALRTAGALRVPRVIAQGSDDERAWLVLEWLELDPLDAASAAALGEALAAQHRLAQPRFGWARDNFIGASPQANGWSDAWLPFWRDRRLAAQLRLAAARRLPSRMIDRGERLAADCDAFLRGHEPARSLLHGDLWSGNAARVRGAGAAVFDPAVYVGDREADIAMTELFGGFPADFHAAYRAAWPLPDDYRARRDLYNLYHVLNHANLFAGDYVSRAAREIDRLLAQIA